jgi:NAD(P)H dehydrogenase (quinone)
MSSSNPILVTGAAGRLGTVGRKIVDELTKKGLKVRALVHSADERAQSLRGSGADVICGDLTNPNDVVRALDGCKRAFSECLFRQVIWKRHVFLQLLLKRNLIWKF